MLNLGIALGARNPAQWWPEGALYAADFGENRYMADGAPIVTTCSEPATSGYQSIKALVDYIRDKKKPADPFLTYKWHIISKDNLEDCPVQF